MGSGSSLGLRCLYNGVGMAVLRFSERSMAASFLSTDGIGFFFREALGVCVKDSLNFLVIYNSGITLVSL